MTIQLKKDNLLFNEKNGLSVINKARAQRPNIDHLVKRIMTERRKQAKANILIFSVLLLISGLITYFVI
jgi:hypothetical protein